jgi:hypothetical protein
MENSKVCKCRCINCENNNGGQKSAVGLSARIEVVSPQPNSASRKTERGVRGGDAGVLCWSDWLGRRWW